MKSKSNSEIDDAVVFSDKDDEEDEADFPNIMSILEANIMPIIERIKART